MVNHLRNLLLNVSGPVVPDGGMDEYVPAGYTSTIPSGYAAVLDNVLFPESEDLEARKARVYVYLRILHATHKEDVLKKDSRITYRFDENLASIKHVDLVKVLEAIKQLPRFDLEGFDVERDYLYYGTPMDSLSACLLIYAELLDQQ